MKKFFAGVVVALIVMVPVAALAASDELPWTKNIYNVSDAERDGNNGRRTTISVFDDGPNKCYVLQSSPTQGAISCVKKEQ